MSGWRTALRIARREARRAKGRSVLVTAMIALPVAAVAFGAVTYDTITLTPDEKADRLMGATQHPTVRAQPALHRGLAGPHAVPTRRSLA